MKTLRNIILVSLILFPATVIAETRITDPNSIINGAFWTKSGSPYILDTDLYVSKGHSLYIDKGVTVLSGTSTNSGGSGSTDIAGGSGDEGKFISLNGDLVIHGTAEEPVRVEGLGMINLDGATVTASYVDLSLRGEVNLSGASSTFDHVSFRGVTDAAAALTARGSRIDISDSEFSGNKSAIRSVLLIDDPVLMRSTGVDDSSSVARLPIEQNRVTIHNSLFYDNARFAIFNDIDNVIDARDNWWGTSTESIGPATTTNRQQYGNTVYGPVDTSDWKHDKPVLVKPICCSNTLFLPGLEASRLYIDRLSPVGQRTATSTNRLWEPNRNDDVRKLFMDSSGKSIDNSVYIKDIIDGGFTYKIYDKFITMMNGLVADGKIKEWLPFAYDWRKDVGEIISDPTQYATTTKSIVAEFLRMASSSPTGKVSIVAHSNGGLVAKMLGKRLEELGKSGLIDKVVFVAVPQWGTPQAIAGILHGDGQSLGKGLILSQGVARTLGLNMPGAYGLLPSMEFFRHITDPVVTIASSTRNGSSTQTALTQIANVDSLATFLTGLFDKRPRPLESETTLPAVLSSSLLSLANALHSKIDIWRFPTSTKVFSIAGWGIPTTKTVNYGNGVPTKTMTNFGDGTVLAPVAGGYDSGANSSDSVGSTTLYVDERKGPDHASILESSTVREMIEDIIASSSSPGSGVGGSLPVGVSYTLPPITSDSWITVGIHSPVDIDVYDNVGGHVGIIPNPDPTSDIVLLDNTIPGAIYDAMGDTKYVMLPASPSQIYDVKLKGTDVGSFTLTLDQTVADRPAVSRTYSELPVTPLLLADFQISSLIDLSHAVVSASSTVPGGIYLDLASTTPPVLHMDVDGNGVADITVPANVGSSTGSGVDPLIYINSIKIIIKSLGLKKAVEKELLSRIDRIGSLIRRGKTEKVRVTLKQMLNRLDSDHIGRDKRHWVHWKAGRITASDRQTLVEMLESLLKALEKDLS